MRLRLLASLLLALVAIVWITPTAVARACAREAAATMACCCGKADAGRGQEPQARRARCCEVECGGAPSDASAVPASLPPIDDGSSVPAELGASADRPARVGDRVPSPGRDPPLSIGPPPWLRLRRLLI